MSYIDILVSRKGCAKTPTFLRNYFIFLNHYTSKRGKTRKEIVVKALNFGIILVYKIETEKFEAGED